MISDFLPIKPSETILVCDLDDTLYPEYSYKLSGINAVCQHISQAYPEYDVATLLSYIDALKNDWLDTLCAKCGFNSDEKQSLLWIYRTHFPHLEQWITASEFKHLSKSFFSTALISDGRSMSQRLKLAALGLSDSFSMILISESEGGQNKPDPARFQAVMDHFPNKHYIYIGDNLKKDFLAPNHLGWLTIGIKPSQYSVYPFQPDDFDVHHQPIIWLNSIKEIYTLLN